MIQVGLFFEDEGHRAFLARSSCASGGSNRPRSRSRSATRQAAFRALTALRQYAVDLRAGMDRFLDVLVVAVDGNCASHHEKVGRIHDAVGDDYAGRLVAAVPDPHIERWYLADPRALDEAVGAPLSVELPPEKCERRLYKRVLREAVRSGGVDPPLGGLEFGEDIAASMALSRARSVPSLRRFIVDFRSAVRSVQAGRPPGA